jgi:hypothetical protein
MDKCAIANGVDIPQQGYVLAMLLDGQQRCLELVHSQQHTSVTGQEELSFLLHMGVSTKAYSL